MQQLSNCYNSIDELPVNIWWKIHETKDCSLLKKGVSGVADELLTEKWNVLNRDFIKEFGINNEFQQYLELLRDIAILKMEKVISEDRKTDLFLKVKEDELEQINKGSKSSWSTTTAFLSKEMGFKIDVAKDSVKEYYSYLKLISKQNEQ